MKQTFILCLLVLLSLLGRAQLTLTKGSHEPVLGDKNKMINVHDTVALLPRNEGANQFWDFSQPIFKYDIFDRGTYVVPTESFVSANIELSKTYYQSLPGRFDIVGQGSYTTTPYPINHLKYSENMAESVWPMSFQTFFSDTAKAQGYSYGGGGIHFSYVAVTAYSLEGTGTGTLIMPGGTVYHNILQVKRSSKSLSHYSSPQTYTTGADLISHSYYHASRKQPLLTLTTIWTTYPNGSQSPKYVILRIDDELKPVGLSNYNQNSLFSVYPNPVSNKLTLALGVVQNEALELTIRNVQGKIISVFYLENTAAKYEIDVSDHAPGLYLLQVTSATKTFHSKFIRN